jgi:hypothetical protein
MRVVREEFAASPAATFLEHQINRLDALLNECMNAAKTAREKVFLGK